MIRFIQACQFTLLVAGTFLGAGVTHAQTVWHVDDNAPLGGDGQSWTTAFKYVQDALTVVGAGDEIRVAGGSYAPDQDEAGHVTPGDREATFQLLDDVALVGGFAGWWADPQYPDTRDIALYQTILCGDLAGDDKPDFEDYDENSFSVITASGVNSRAVLDGFTVARGYANMSTGDHRGRGAGLYNIGGLPTLLNCAFRDNWAAGGAAGAVYNENRVDSLIVNCTFINNRAGNNGGALVNAGISAPLIINCSFLGNYAPEYGGGVLNNNYSDATLINCLFSGNVSDDGGGALMQWHNAMPTLINCTISENSTSARGGGIYHYDGGGVIMENCILWGNTDSGSSDEQAQIRGGLVNVDHSCVQGWTGDLGGSGNIGDDPAFLDPLGPDGIAGTEDDDLRLDFDSPCLDAGNDAAVWQDLIDLDGDGDALEPLPFDLDFNPRFSDADGDHQPTVDMGAYETRSCFGDLTDDGMINLADLAALLANFGQWGMGHLDGDLTGDTYVGLDDLAMLLAIYNTPC